MFETETYDRVNRYIGVGWVMLGVFSRQYSENGYGAYYSLGWLKQNGDVTHPEKTLAEKATEAARQRIADGDGVF